MRTFAATGDRRSCRLNREERIEQAHLLDGLLIKVFRGKGALALRIGEYFRWFKRGDRLITVGYARLTDFAREECGLPSREAATYCRLAATLETRPVLHAAVRAGAVTPKKADLVKRLAVGDDEPYWTLRAEQLSVLKLKAEVARVLTARDGEGSPEKDAPDAWPPADQDLRDLDSPEVWQRITLPATQGQLRLFKETVELARHGLGADAPVGRCVEAMAQELLSEAAPPIDPVPGHGLPPGSKPRRKGRDSPNLREWLEEQTANWAFLDHAVPTLAPDIPVTDSTDPFEVRAEVIRLSRLMRDWDVLACRLALLLRERRLWHDLKFASLDHYASERLGVCGRTLEQRAWLEAKMFDWPELRTALQEGVLCYARTLEVARADGEISIEWAAEHPVLEIRKRADDIEEAKMCDDGQLRVTLPPEAVDLVDEAIRAIQHVAAEAGIELSGVEAFWLMVQHAHDTWKPLAPKLEPLRRHLRARKHALCEAYGCTMPGIDMHHVDMRSHQGPDGADNRVLLCRPHHQQGAHGPGHTEIVRLGNERFEWRFGCREGRPPLRVVITGDPPEPDAGRPRPQEAA